jgi:Zn-dependent protease
MSAYVPSTAVRSRGFVLARRPVPIVASKGSLVPVVMLAALFALYSSGASALLVLGAAVLGGIGGLGSLIVHELGHVRAARRLKGVRPVRVSLLWLGAGTKFEGAYRSGGDQAKVALAGPAASFGLAVVLFVVAFMPFFPRPAQYGLFGLALLNLTIAAVSLIPVHPLDGHKVLVALFWRFSGSERRARSILRRAGKAWLLVEGITCMVLVVERPLLGGCVMAVGAAIYLQKWLSVRGASLHRLRRPHPATLRATEHASSR